MKSVESRISKNRFKLFCTASTMVVLVIAVLLAGGCGRKGFRALGAAPAPTKGRRSKEELRDALNGFEDLALDRIKAGANELDKYATTSAAREITVLWKTRALKALATVSSQEDAVVSFLDTWVWCARMTNYFETGEGSLFFLEHQHIAINTSKELELEIEEIAEEYLEEEMFEKTRRTVSVIALANPVRGIFSNMVFFATQIKPGEPGYLDAVAGIPLAPFRALEGVDRTPVAINRFTDTAKDFADVVEELPESFRWNMLLLLFDLEESEMAKSFLGSLAEFSRSTARMADSAEKMPESVRKELSVFVEEVEAKQANLQTTLDKAEKTATSIERSLKLADRTAGTVGETAKIAGEVAATVERTAQVAHQTLKDYQAGQPENPPPFDIKELRKSAESAEAAVNGVRALLEDFRELMESDAMVAHVAAIRGLSTHFAWQMGLLILLVFVLALVYRIIVVLVVSKGKQDARKQQ